MKIRRMRVDGRANTRRVWIDGREVTPVRSWAVYNHSPDGFNWGYGGSGPAQLALAILLEAGVDDGAAYLRHQDFKREFVALLPLRDFDATVTIRSDGKLVEWDLPQAKAAMLSDLPPADGDAMRRRIAEVDAARSDGRVSI